ncbi:hypothetical protein NEOLEDRAFT_1130479 [Neolentinus lepideus HHB14362 ss-1]|uniref:AB hydrolase-1 domain-containing protein n=1 Tax=Neolentinus lepideus HHB14362 ss-1 TaxID=1314782 RepID=A0A165U1S2_9AGAM|nr:hypothetical protein NEOLEDRAFT_1130479 [Neolentinus lepideus HHB14362 ss-1]
MPLALVDDHGTQLYYEDSGAPLSSTYTTLFLIHGAVFHSAIFQRLFPYASEHQLRLVTVNRRDYPGSTPYSPEELEVLQGQDKNAQTALLRTLGLQISTFIDWFVKSKKILPLSVSTDEHKTGGFAMIGWSAGGVLVLSILAHAHTFLDGIVQTIGDYCRTFILYDVPQFICELPYPPPGAYHPMWDPTIPQERMLPTAYSWMSGYFAHPSPSSRAMSGLSQVLNTSKTPTIDRMTPAELESVSSLSALQTSDRLLLKMAPGVHLANLWQALTVSSTCHDGKSVWPEAECKLVLCMESSWETFTCRWGIEGQRKELQDQNVLLRNFSVHEFYGANHFAHWDIPQETIDFMANIIRS